MATLRHHVAPLLAFALVAGCGGDRSRTAAGGDTTGAAAATPDSTGMPAGTTAAPAAADTARSAAADTSGKTSATDTGAKRATATPPAKKKTTAAKAKPAEKPESTNAAAAPAAAPAPAPAPQQDTSKAPAAAAEQPLRDAYHQAPKDTVSEAVYDGWKQFNLNCARCHGEDVLGTTIAPHLIVSLKPNGPINSKELFVQTVCAGRPQKGMPSWCALGLDMSKINDIYEYVKGRSDAKISPGRPAVKQGG